ncbi:nucleotidyltransferase [Paenibacillus sp. A3]|nr:nucleotidyltransferase domain-containing protein [Paenibacillus sp. A3]KPV61153.1 nucleotidyltransferase [Paenibacillus sp. A3]
MSLSGLEAAKRFVNMRFPQSEAAILAGSVVQGGATPGSDLDVVVFDESQYGPFRKTYRAFGWIIEAFVMNRGAYRYFFDQAVESAIPSLLRMCSEGIVLHGHEHVAAIIEEARRDLDAGPPAWSIQELDRARYEIGETLTDLECSASRAEGLFITAKLAGMLVEFALRTGGFWIGDGKWLQRSLKLSDPAQAEELYEALEAYYRLDRTEPLSAFVQKLLEPFGGFLVEGYAEGDDPGEEESGP